MARAFAEHKVLFPRHAVEGFLNLLDERFVVRRLEILPGEVRLDGDGAHVHQRTVEPKHRVHQHGVLVNLLLLDLDEALADRLDVADAGEMFLQRGDEAERGGGLAVVLPGGRDEDARGGQCSCGYSPGSRSARARIAAPDS